jgi:hypothetical protein
VAARCRESDAFTLELGLRAHSLRPRPGDGRVVSLEEPDGRILFQLYQRGPRLRARLRAAEADPEIGVAFLEAERTTHLVVTYRDGHLLSYQDGAKVLDTDRVQGSLDEWEDGALLVLGDAAGGGRDWSGVLEAAALYCRSMAAEEAASNAQAFRARLDERDAVPRARARARLLARSDLPTLEQITPYREALVLHEYEVLRVLDGTLDASRVRVAHWAILDGTPLPGPAAHAPGAELRLALEPWAENPQVHALYLSDTLDLDPQVPVFLDVGP